MASDFRIIKADSNAACERLDVKRLNGTPAALVMPELVAYIDGYVEGLCEEEMPSVAPVARAVDLAYLNERLEIFPSSVVFPDMPNIERLEAIKGRLEKTLRKSSRLSPQSVDYTPHDVAVVLFMSCQTSAFTNLEICPSERFDMMVTMAEGYTFDERQEIVGALMELRQKKADKKKRYATD